MRSLNLEQWKALFLLLFYQILKILPWLSEQLFNQDSTCWTRVLWTASRCTASNIGISGATQSCLVRSAARGLQRDVVYLGWPIAPSYMSPNAGGVGGGGIVGSQPMSTAVHRSPNKLWRSNSIFKWCGSGPDPAFHLDSDPTFYFDAEMSPTFHFHTGLYPSFHFETQKRIQLFMRAGSFLPWTD
jgi:hypothetical protein